MRPGASTQPGPTNPVSSPITFSGFNNIDFNTVLNEPHAAGEPAADRAADASRRTCRSQVGRIRSRSSTRVAALRAGRRRARADPGIGVDSWPARRATRGRRASRPAPTPSPDTTTSSSTSWRARRSRRRASSAPDANTTVVATGGTLTIGGVDGRDRRATSRCSSWPPAINGTTGIGVTASVVRTGANELPAGADGHADGRGQRLHDHATR